MSFHRRYTSKLKSSAPTIEFVTLYPPMQRQRTHLAWLCEVLLLGLASCQASPAGQPAKQPQVQKVAALGRLEPRDRVIDISVAGDERLSRLLVKEGQFVEAGEVLAYLESFERRLTNRDRTVTALQDAEAAFSANTQLGQARIREAELRRMQIREVPSREIQAQEAKVRETQANLDLAALELKRIRTLQESEIVPQRELDRQTSTVSGLQAALESDEAILQKLRVSAATDLEIAEAQVDTRKTELASSQAAAQLESLRQAVRVAEAELKESVIRAPSRGQIIEVVANPSESVLGRVILRMGDVSQMNVLAEVYEADVSRVNIGQPVEVTSPALSKPIRGIVERIGTSVSKKQVPDLDPQADTDVRVVQVRARLDTSEEAARFVGLQVDVRIGPRDSDQP
jgi:HlyD family secretion protein